MSCGSVQFFEAHYTKDQDALMKLLSGGATCDVVDSTMCSTMPKFALLCPESCAPDKLKERGRGCNAETCPPPGTCHGGVGGLCWTTDKDWKKLANTQCTEFLPHDPMLTDIASAEIKCLKNPNCGGVSGAVVVIACVLDGAMLPLESGFRRRNAVSICSLH